ncbi:MAG TPA: signal peptidase II [Tepidiformaceae bacterium]|nr:signal peptidase II [Tepidiformaceae bacterium]
MTDAPLEATPRVRVRPGDAWLLLAAILIVAADQFSKWAIRETVDRGSAWPSEDWWIKIVHITNSGAAFGILQGAGPLLAVTSIIGMALIFVYLFNPGFAHPLMRLGLALMLGGAVGNLIDRVVRGEVVDFIKVPNWPAFNVADSAITIGVLCLLWATLRETGDSSSESS